MFEFDKAVILLKYKNLGEGKVHIENQAVLENGEEKSPMPTEVYLAFLKNTIVATEAQLQQQASGISVPSVPEKLEKEKEEEKEELVLTTKTLQ